MPPGGLRRTIFPLLTGAVAACGCAASQQHAHSHGQPEPAIPSQVVAFSQGVPASPDPPQQSGSPADEIATAVHAAASDETASDETASGETASDETAIELTGGKAVPPPPELLPDESGIRAAVEQQVVPIDLATALQISGGQNPQVNFARQRIHESYAQLQQAEILWVPSLRAGFNWHKHEGRIQDVAGEIIDTSRGAIYTGMGAMAVGAGSPAVPGLGVTFHLADAVFQPEIAGQALGARQQASRAVTNDTLLETALAYLDLLEALQLKAVSEETQAHAERLVELTQSFAETGQGLQEDADRARADLAVRAIEVRRAEEQIRVASARLTQMLSRDQRYLLLPQEPVLAPIDLVDGRLPLPELVAQGLSQRPELAEHRYLVGEAVQRLRREQYAPLIPSVLLGMSYGGNGGGFGSDISNFGDRFDFDIGAWWEIRNFGAGERWARDEARSRVEQARWLQVRVMDQVASEVTASHAQTEMRREQIAFAEQGISAAADSYRRNLERISEAQGLPIEALQSIQALDQARRQYVRAVADYNRAQFTLHRNLGWPVQ